MLGVLEFIFRDFTTWLGIIILILVIGGALGFVVSSARVSGP